MQNRNQQIEFLCQYLFKSPIFPLINSVTFETKFNGKTSCLIDLSNWKQAVYILSNSPFFIDANLGYLHYTETGEPCFDFRSFTVGRYALGKRSLQINIGKTKGVTRADLDLYNPVESLNSFLGHTLEVLNIL